YSNTNAWMTGEIFKSWLSAWDTELQQNGCKVLLLLDNFAGHSFNPEVIKCITIVKLVPNLTAHVQPMDAGIIHSMKRKYRYE
ncbi:CENP-B protein, partial [Coemansia reversa NRRL 1564]